MKLISENPSNELKQVVDRIVSLYGKIPEAAIADIKSKIVKINGQQSEHTQKVCFYADLFAQNKIGKDEYSAFCESMPFLNKGYELTSIVLWMCAYAQTSREVEIQETKKEYWRIMCQEAFNRVYPTVNFFMPKFGICDESEDYKTAYKEYCAAQKVAADTEMTMRLKYLKKVSKVINEVCNNL